jgi:hypothetical protein
MRMGRSVEVLTSSRRSVDHVVYRASSCWYLYPFIAVSAATLLSGAVGAAPHIRGIGDAIAFAIASVLSVWLVIHLVLWNRRLGVHVDDRGLRSVGYSRTVTFAWDEISGFSVDRYRAGTITVFAERTDGSRVGLYAVQAWPYQRAKVERFRAALERERIAHQTLSPR